MNHYRWAGLDFMFDEDGSVVFLEANRCSHMLQEYLALYGDTAPFAATARVMNEADGPPCLLWRRQDRATGEEEACWIGVQLRRHLRREPIIGFVEDNQEERPELVSRDGERVRPGSVFRWWYPAPWSWERSGVRVINPNAVWVVVRDKLASYQRLAQATHFRVPRSFAVEGPEEAENLVAGHPEVFRRGFVLKPRVGFGGHGVQIGAAGTALAPFSTGYLLCERIRPPLRGGCYWDVRTFVLGGRYHGGIVRLNRGPVTNVFQGGTAVRLDPPLAAQLEAATLEAVRLLDEAADAVARGPALWDSPLLRVTW